MAWLAWVLGRNGEPMKKTILTSLVMVVLSANASEGWLNTDRENGIDEITAPYYSSPLPNSGDFSGEITAVNCTGKYIRQGFCAFEIVLKRPQEGRKVALISEDGGLQRPMKGFAVGRFDNGVARITAR